MTNTSKDYDINDLVIYRPFGGGTRRVRVATKEADVKNGRPGFSGQLVDEDGSLTAGDTYGVWGYDSQIVEVQPW